MPKIVAHILLLFIAFIGLGAYFFAGLMLHLPIYFALALWGLALYLLYKQLSKYNSNGLPFVAYAIAIIAIIGLAIQFSWSLYIQPTVDADGMWNYYASFLFTDDWQRLFTIKDSYYQPSHPMGLPASIATIWRIIGHQSIAASLVPCLLLTFLVPLFVYFATWRIHWPTAIISLVYFVTNKSYHSYAYGQMADLYIGLAFAGCVYTTLLYKSTNRSIYLLWAGVLAGCLIWIKNEGLLLVLVWSALHILSWQKKTIYYISGILPFAILLGVYKYLYAADSAVQVLTPSYILNHISNPENYKFIALHVFILIKRTFFLPAFACTLYVVLCASKRQFPNYFFISMLIIFGAILSVFLVTPTDIDWQLGTSLYRIFYEILPAYIVVMAYAFNAFSSKQNQINNSVRLTN